ncbi:MAG TPA: L,D-transpeptidase family protein [Chthoniobacteraceae bacterium]|nr:L,D-transpeptidase family protein [Chthoniobacteraceae bacterium]
MKQIACLFLALSGLFLNSGCFTRDPRYSDRTPYMGGFHRAGDQGRAKFDDVSYWEGDGAAGSPSVKISLGEQRAYFYKGNELVGISIISTGREGHNTPTGSYRIQQKDKDHKSSIYGDYVDASGNVLKKDIERGKDPMPPGGIFDGAKMPNFMRITGGVGMHQGFLPGYPASHGCIRMPGFMSENFFNSVSVGTPVTITN